MPNLGFAVASTRPSQFIVYMDDDLARHARSAAQAHGGNASAYLRSLVERDASASQARPAGDRRMLEFLVGGVRKLLEDRKPEYVKEVVAKHAERMAKGQSYAD